MQPLTQPNVAKPAGFLDQHSSMCLIKRRISLWACPAISFQAFPFIPSVLSFTAPSSPCAKRVHMSWDIDRLTFSVLKSPVSEDSSDKSRFICSFVRDSRVPKRSCSFWQSPIHSVTGLEGPLMLNIPRRIFSYAWRSFPEPSINMAAVWWHLLSCIPLSMNRCCSSLFLAGESLLIDKADMKEIRNWEFFCRLEVIENLPSSEKIGYHRIFTYTHSYQATAYLAFAFAPRQ